MKSVLMALFLAAGGAQALDLASMPQLHKNGVVETPGLVFSALAAQRPLDLTLYQPEHARGSAPVVMFVHGGGWVEDPFHPPAGVAENQASAADNDRIFFDLAKRGFVVANITYRLTGEAVFPAQIQDVKQAVRFLRIHAAEFGGNPDRIIAWGASAGGYLAVLAGTSCGATKLEPPAGAPSIAAPGERPKGIMPTQGQGLDPKVSDCVEGVVDWYGPVDFASLGGNHVAPQSSQSLLLGCPVLSCSADRLRDASAYTYISPRNPPFLIIQGLADGAVPPSQSETLASKLKAVGVPVKLTMVPGANHLFLGIPKAQSDQLTEETFAWLEQFKR